MAPRIRDVPALDDDVVDRTLGETAACRQSSVAGSDDDRRDVFDDELRWAGRRR
jgi:hypothetical protein